MEKVVLRKSSVDDLYMNDGDWDDLFFLYKRNMNNNMNYQGLNNNGHDNNEDTFKRVAADVTL